MNKHFETEQLGFDAFLNEADTDNRARAFERETAHLPGTMDAAIPVYRGLIEQNHAAVLAAGQAETRWLHKEARLLARKLNGGEPGILAHDDAPGYVLAPRGRRRSGRGPALGPDRGVHHRGRRHVRAHRDGRYVWHWRRLGLLARLFRPCGRPGQTLPEPDGLPQLSRRPWPIRCRA